VESPDITADELLDHIRFLASDELQGRASGTEGNERAAQYIADQFRAAGLAPGGDNGTYFQRFEFTAGVRLGEPNSMTLRVGGTETVLKVERDFLPLAFSDSGTVSGEVVFAGFGISSPDELKYDDYAGLDVRGKIVLAFRYTPEGDDPQSKFEPYAPLRRKAMTAREKGAVGLLFVTPPLQEEDLGAFRFDASSADSGLLGAILRRVLLPGREEALLPGLSPANGRGGRRLQTAAGAGPDPTDVAGVVRDGRRRRESAPGHRQRCGQLLPLLHPRRPAADLRLQPARTRRPQF
jgi:hypothetical protein